MKNKAMDALQIWKQMEDEAVLRLKLTVYEHVVYTHLLRHSHLEGKARIGFSIRRLARGTGLTRRAGQKALQGLHTKGALRLAEYNREGYVIDVRLPEEIWAVRAGQIEALASKTERIEARLEEMDFMVTRWRREAIHNREGGRCFYCMRRVTPKTRCLDHVVSQVRGGNNGYRNLVSACGECNGKKGVQRAEDFLRWLYRESCLSQADFKGRMRALQELAAGKLRPVCGADSPRSTVDSHRVAG